MAGFSQVYVSGRRAWHQLKKPHFWVLQHWKLQDLAGSFESAAGFPRVVIVLHLDWGKQPVRCAGQSVREYLPLLVRPLEWFCRVLYMGSGCLWAVPSSCHGASRGKVVLGLVASLFLCPYDHIHSGPWNLLLGEQEEICDCPQTAWKQSQGIQQHLVQQDHTLSA